MNLKVKLALVKNGLTLQDVADHIGRSKTLVSLILSNKHVGHDHRPKIARMLGLREKDLNGRGDGRGVRG